MHRRHTFYLVLFLGCGLAGMAFGETTTVTLKDGSQLKGSIEKMDSQSIEFLGNAGELSIPVEKVERIDSEMNPALVLPAEESTTKRKRSKKAEPSVLAPPYEDLGLPVRSLDKDSIYNHRMFGLGYAVGPSTGMGLSGLFRISPVSLVVTGTPLREGYDLGAQLQVDVFSRGSRRIYLCAGTSYYQSEKYSVRGTGVGGGFGWMVAKLIGLSANIALSQGHNDYRTPTPYQELNVGGNTTDELYLNLNLMFHFYFF